MLSETISTWWGCELAAPSRASPAASSTGRAGWSGGAKHPTPGLSWKGISSFYKLFHKFSGALALYILMKILSRWIARAVRSSWCHLFVRLSPQSMTNYDCRIAVYARSAVECNKVSPKHICHFSANPLYIQYNHWTWQWLYDELTILLHSNIVKINNNL